MNSDEITIREIARMALEDATMRENIGVDLDLSDDELDRIHQQLKGE